MLILLIQLALYCILLRTKYPFSHHGHVFQVLLQGVFEFCLLISDCLPNVDSLILSVLLHNRMFLYRVHFFIRTVTVNTYENITLIFISKFYSFLKESLESTPGRVSFVRVNLTVNGVFFSNSFCNRKDVSNTI